MADGPNAHPGRTLHDHVIHIGPRRQKRIATGREVSLDVPERREHRIAPGRHLPVKISAREHEGNRPGRHRALILAENRDGRIPVGIDQDRGKIIRQHRRVPVGVHAAGQNPARDDEGVFARVHVGDGESRRLQEGIAPGIDVEIGGFPAGKHQRRVPGGDGAVQIAPSGHQGRTAGIQSTCPTVPCSMI